MDGNINTLFASLAPTIRNVSVAVGVFAFMWGAVQYATSGGGSAVSRKLYAVDDPACGVSALGSCLAHSGPIPVSIGTHAVTHVRQDVAGNTESSKQLALVVQAPPTVTSTSTPTATPTYTPTATHTPTLTATPSPTTSPIVTPRPIDRPTATPSLTPTPTSAPTLTSTATKTATPTRRATPTAVDSTLPQTMAVASPPRNSAG